MEQIDTIHNFPKSYPPDPGLTSVALPLLLFLLSSRPQIQITLSRAQSWEPGAALAPGFVQDGLELLTPNENGQITGSLDEVSPVFGGKQLLFIGQRSPGQQTQSPHLHRQTFISVVFRFRLDFIFGFCPFHGPKMKLASPGTLQRPPNPRFSPCKGPENKHRSTKMS